MSGYLDTGATARRAPPSFADSVIGRALARLAQANAWLSPASIGRRRTGKIGAAEHRRNKRGPGRDRGKCRMPGTPRHLRGLPVWARIPARVLTAYERADWAARS